METIDELSRHPIIATTRFIRPRLRFDSRAAGLFFEDGDRPMLGQMRLSFVDSGVHIVRPVVSRDGAQGCRRLLLPQITTKVRTLDGRSSSTVLGTILTRIALRHGRRG
jgi:hypothetical protein